MKKYLLNLAIALDQMLNALFRGEPDETLSSRAHRMREKNQPYWGWIANMIDLLFFWQKNHCEWAYQQEIQRQQLPPRMRSL